MRVHVCPYLGGETTHSPTAAPTLSGAQTSVWTPNNWKCFIAGNMCDETSFIPERNTSTASYYDTIGKLRFLSFNGTNLRRILNNVTESSTFLLEEYNTQMNKTANVLLPTIAQRKTELELAVRELDVAFLLVGAVTCCATRDWFSCPICSPHSS